MTHKYGFIVCLYDLRQGFPLVECSSDCRLQLSFGHTSRSRTDLAGGCQLSRHTSAAHCVGDSVQIDLSTVLEFYPQLEVDLPTSCTRVVSLAHGRPGSRAVAVGGETWTTGSGSGQYCRGWQLLAGQRSALAQMDQYSSRSPARMCQSEAQNYVSNDGIKLTKYTSPGLDPLRSYTAAVSLSTTPVAYCIPTQPMHSAISA